MPQAVRYNAGPAERIADGTTAALPIDEDAFTIVPYPP
jgi:hypothetical protein